MRIFEYTCATFWVLPPKREVERVIVLLARRIRTCVLCGFLAVRLDRLRYEIGVHTDTETFAEAFVFLGQPPEDVNIDVCRQSSDP